MAGAEDKGPGGSLDAALSPTGAVGGEEAGPKFEDAMARLEQVVHGLEGGTLSLDDSLRAFEEGTMLLRYCARRLEAAERRIEILTREDTELRAQPFPWDEEPG